MAKCKNLVAALVPKSNVLKTDLGSSEWHGFGRFCVEKIKVWAKSIFFRLMYVRFGKIPPYKNKGLRTLVLCT